MKKSSLVILLILLTIAHAYSLSESEIAQKAFSSVVVVIIADENGEIISAGSGFFVKENIVVTNLHIIASGVVGFVKIVAKEEKYIIEGLVGVDKTRDIILLKIKDIKTSFLELGDSDKMKIDDILKRSSHATCGITEREIVVRTENKMKTISLLGKDGGKLKGFCDYEFIIPAETSDRIQELHMTILHVIIEGVERILFPENY